jgi:hypothetical protein
VAVGIVLFFTGVFIVMRTVNGDDNARLPNIILGKAQRQTETPGFSGAVASGANGALAGNSTTKRTKKPAKRKTGH